MSPTYPVQGYRTAGARRRAAPPGFQSGGPPAQPPGGGDGGNSNAALLDAMMEAQYGRDALRKAIRETERRERHPGFSRTPLSEGQRESRQALIKRLTGFRRLHPALRAVDYALNIGLSLQRDSAPGQFHFPGQHLHKYCNWGEDGSRPHRYQWGLPNLCIEGQAFGAGNDLNAPYTVPELASDGASLWEDGVYFGATRSRTREIYVWDNSLDAALATPGIKDYPWAKPVISPRVAPMAMPIGKVTPVEAPMSKAAVAALAEATAANEGILPGLWEKSMRGPNRYREVQPYPQMSVSVERKKINGRRKTRIVGRMTWLKALVRAPYVNPRKREKKWNLSKELMFMLGMPTELMDLVDSVYEALPEEFRRKEKGKRHGKDPSPHEKVRLLMLNAKLVDGAKMLGNIARDQLQDAAYAYASKRGVALNNSMGYSFGLTQNSTAKNYAQRFTTSKVETVKYGSASPAKAKGGRYGIQKTFLYQKPPRRIQGAKH